MMVDPHLTERAQARVEQLCTTGEFSHRGFNALEGFDLGHMKFNYYGENIAKGFSNDLDAFNAFMHSPTHRANILDSKFTHIGVGEACGLKVILFGGRG